MNPNEGCNCCERGTAEMECSSLRKVIENVKSNVVNTMNHPEINNDSDVELSGANVPKSRNANMKANLTLAFRHLEDARMRLGKAMQAYQGGISILDK